MARVRSHPRRTEQGVTTVREHSRTYADPRGITWYKDPETGYIKITKRGESWTYIWLKDKDSINEFEQWWGEKIKPGESGSSYEDPGYFY